MKKSIFLITLIIAVMLSSAIVTYADDAPLLGGAMQPVVDMTVTSDSGYFDDGTGVIRFITTVNQRNVDVISYGTYIVPLALFDDVNKSYRTGLYLNSTTINPGESYQADLADIPASHLDSEVYAISFAVIDYEYGETGEPQLYSQGVTAKVDRSKHLGESYDAMKEAE